MRTIKLAFALMFGATGCSLTPKLPASSASSPVSAEAHEGHVHVSTISLIEKSGRDEKSDDHALSSRHGWMNQGKGSMAGMDHSNMKMED